MSLRWCDAFQDLQSTASLYNNHAMHAAIERPPRHHGAKLACWCLQASLHMRGDFELFFFRYANPNGREVRTAEQLVAHAADLAEARFTSYLKGGVSARARTRLLPRAPRRRCRRTVPVRPQFGLSLADAIA